MKMKAAVVVGPARMEIQEIELRTLKEIGVTQGQGFLIARPMVPPIDEHRILERLGV